MAIELIHMTDEAVRELRANGWIIKAPYFRNGEPVFVAVKRG